MVSEWGASAPKRLRNVAFHVSTALLSLALLGLLLRLSSADAPLSHISEMAVLLLVTLAPVWALFGSVVATIYLVLTVWRPHSYSAGQHLLEMVLGIVLTIWMRPIF